MRNITRFASYIAVVLATSVAVAGCGHSRGRNPGTGGGGGGGGGTTPVAPHFTTLKTNDPSGLNSVQIINGSRTNNEGLVFWHSITTSVSGNNVKAEVTIYFGPYGDDDNSLATTDVPYLLPNYDQGAENGRGAADYVPIRLTAVPGGGNQLWRATIDRFPTNGRFLFTITRDGNRLPDPNGNLNKYLRGLQNDSSFLSDKGCLTARYDSASRKIILP